MMHAVYRRIGEWLLTGRRQPMTLVYLAVIVLRIPGLFWGLPSTDGWDDDAVAPRDFLPGLVESFTPGHFYTYPPVHLALLALATAPVWIAKLLTLGTTDARLVVAGFIAPGTMTAFAVVARMVAIAFACVTVHALSELAALLVPAERAARTRLLVGALLVGNATLTYYGQVGNLDGPYLAWSCLALLEIARTDVLNQPKRWLRFALYAALAVGTKDQAYAVFLFAVPVWFAVRATVSAAARQSVVRDAKWLVVAGVLTLVLLLVLDGAFVNPRGFLARIHFLLGPASQDHAYYTQDAQGRLRLLMDVLWVRPSNYYPMWVWALFPTGIVLACWHRKSDVAVPAALATRLLPLLALLSFSVAFNMTARRTEHRFLLPQSALAAVYMGIALEQLTRVSKLGSLAAVVTVLAAWRGSIGVGLVLLGDPRNKAEAWLRTHAATATIETYGNNVYLPRMPAGARVARVGEDSPGKRSVVPGFVEVQASPAEVEARKPAVLVVSEGWSGPIAWAGAASTGGYQTSRWLLNDRGDGATRQFLQALREGSTRYRLALRAEYKSGLFPTPNIHASTAMPMLIYQRISD
jgi:hypothetical protein